MNQETYTNAKILPECVQMFKNVEFKLDQLIDRADKINGRYEKHLDSSESYRKLVDQHEYALDLIKNEKFNTAKLSQWRVGLIASVMTAVLTTIIRVLWK